MEVLAITAGDVEKEVLSSELSSNTRMAYEKGWRKFEAFCLREQITDLLSVPPEEVARFLVHLGTSPNPQNGVIPSIGTVLIYKSAVNKKYIEAGKPSPTSHAIVRSALRGLARVKGSSSRRVEALREFHIAAMLQSCPDTLMGKRDAAILAVGFAGALRRSELCNLAVDDVKLIDPKEDGGNCMWLTIQKSKTDQQGKGQRVAILDGKVIRPIGHLQAWLRASGITEGPIFQTMRRGGHLRGKPLHHSDVPRIVKHYAARIGLDPKDIAGHSLRAGFVTSAAVHHARLDKIMAVTRHTNPATVMQYIRDADAFTDHAGQHFL